MNTPHEGFCDWDCEHPAPFNWDKVEPKSGDFCRILGNFEVEHYHCDEFADGVVTNVITGKIVR